MSFYSNMAATARRLLTKYGQTVTLTYQSAPTLNPVTGSLTSTPVEYTGKGAAFDYRAAEIDGVLVQAGDIRLILEATTTAPAVGHTCAVGGVTYRVMAITTSAPGGTTTHYTLQLRI